MVSGLALLLKHIQIVGHGVLKHLVVTAVGMVGIPFRFAVIGPGVRRDSVSEVGVVDLLDEL